MASSNDTPLKHLLRYPGFFGDQFEEELERKGVRENLGEQDNSNAEEILRSPEIEARWNYDPEGSHNRGSRKSRKSRTMESYSFFLQGHSPNLKDAVSYVSAEIIENRRKDPSALVIGYFCRECPKVIKDSGDCNHRGDDWIRYMLKSLIGQLLDAAQESGIDIRVKYSGDALNLASQEDLLKLLKASIRSLPKHITLYCILDGIEVYEGKEKASEDFLKFASGFTGFIRSRRKAPHVKLLLTTTSFCDLIATDGMIEIPGENLHSREDNSIYAEEGEGRIKVDRWLYVPDAW